MDVIKFKSNVLYKASDVNKAVLISFDLDEYLNVFGPLVKVIPTIEKGAKLSELVDALKADLPDLSNEQIETELKNFISFLKSWGFMETSDVAPPTLVFRFETSIGSVDVLNHEKVEYDIYAFESWEWTVTFCFIAIS